MRVLEKKDAPILTGYQLFHNYIRPHMALDTRTPAEAAGIQVKGDKKGLTLIQNASAKQTAQNFKDLKDKFRFTYGSSEHFIRNVSKLQKTILSFRSASPICVELELGGLYSGLGLGLRRCGRSLAWSRTGTTKPIRRRKPATLLIAFPRREDARVQIPAAAPSMWGYNITAQNGCPRAHGFTCVEVHVHMASAAACMTRFA